MKFIKYVVNQIAKLIIKYHTCEKHLEIHSTTFRNDWLTEIEYECTYCGEKYYERYPEGYISKLSYEVSKAVSAHRNIYTRKYY